MKYLLPLIFVSGICFGYYLHMLLNPPATGIVTPKTETHIVRRPAPATGDIYEREKFYRDCYLSDIVIYADYKAPTLTVTARDDCREATREFNLQLSENENFRLYAGIAIGAILAGGAIWLSSR